MKPKSALNRYLALAGSSLLAVPSAQADSGDWIYDGATAASLLWSTAGSWSSNPTVPGTVAGDVINFTNDITAARTITIDTTSRTVGALTIGDFNNTHFFTLAASGGAGLIMDNGGSGATITSTTTLATLTTARDTISAPITLADNLAVSVAGTYSGGVSTAGYFGITGNIGESGGVRSITKNGNGALVLTGNNTYSGGFTLNAGTVQVLLNGNEVNNAYTGFGTGTLTINGGTIATRSAGSFTTANNSIWNGNFSLYRGQTGTATWNHDGNVTLGGNITVTPTNAFFVLNINGDIGETGGARSLTFSSGNLTPTLSGTNTYTGGTNVTSGTIRFAKAASMPTTGNVAMSTNTTLIVNAGGTGEFTSATSGAGSLGAVLGAGTPVTWTGTSRLSIDTSNAAGAFSYGGTIVNRGTSLGITKQGSGTLALTATDSTYTGSTIISAGILEVTKLSTGSIASSIGASNPTLSTNLLFGNNTTLRYVGAGDDTNRTFRIDGGNGSVITLDASGTGAINFTNTANPNAAGSNQGATIVLAGTNTGANTFAANVADVGTGVRSITKDGTGTWVLTGTSTYTGDTTVDDGKLLINGSTSTTSLVTVNSGGTLGGTGTIGGSVILNSGSTLSPGASIESLATGSNTWNGGSTIAFEFSTDGNTGAAGTEWDLLTITGTLGFGDATALNRINFDLITMLDATTAGSLGTWDPNASATWAGFVTTTGGITGFDSDFFAFDTSGFQNAINGTFSIAQNGNNLDLIYTAIPEPATALLGSLGLLFLLRRRR